MNKEPDGLVAAIEAGEQEAIQCASPDNLNRRACPVGIEDCRAWHQAARVRAWINQQLRQVCVADGWDVKTMGYQRIVRLDAVVGALGLDGEKEDA